MSRNDIILYVYNSKNISKYIKKITRYRPDLYDDLKSDLILIMMKYDLNILKDRLLKGKLEYLCYNISSRRLKIINDDKHINESNLKIYGNNFDNKFDYYLFKNGEYQTVDNEIKECFDDIEKYNKIMDWMRFIKPDWAQSFIMYYRDNLTYTDISDKLIKIDGKKVNYHSILRKVKKVETIIKEKIKNGDLDK